MVSKIKGLDRHARVLEAFPEEAWLTVLDFLARSWIQDDMLDEVGNVQDALDCMSDWLKLKGEVSG